MILLSAPLVWVLVTNLLYLNSSDYNNFFEYNLRVSLPHTSSPFAIGIENVRTRIVLGVLESDFHEDRDFALFIVI